MYMDHQISSIKEFLNILDLEKHTWVFLTRAHIYVCINLPQPLL